MSFCTLEDLARRDFSPEAAACVFHLHVPKAAGSTVDAYFLENGYGMEQVSPLDAHWQVSLPAAGTKRLMAGHFRLNHPIFNFMSRPHMRVTMLREPVARMLSSYNFTLRHPEASWHQQIVSGAMEFTDFAAVTAQELGLQYTYFDTTGDGCVVAPRGWSSAQACLENLLTEVTFYGIAECFDEFVAAMAAWLGWRRLLVQSINVTKGLPAPSGVPTKVDLLPDERDALLDLLSDDLWFYEQAVQAYDARVNSPSLREVIATGRAVMALRRAELEANAAATAAAAREVPVAA